MLLHVIAVAQVITAPPLISGTVRSAESGQPLGFSIVTLEPGGRRQFTDAAGAFVFESLSSGRYVLSVRQIGYAPLDSQIVVAGDSATVLHIVLRHLAIELPPVTVSTHAACTRPGRPDSASSPALAAVFDQLQDNARRFLLLAREYPFDYELEQTILDVDSRGDSARPLVDTIRLGSRLEHPYEPGHVVTPPWGPWRGDLVIRTLSLEEFASRAFVANHCFYLAGRDTVEGETLVRIDFEPSRRLGADLAGSAFLDSSTYQLRYTVSSLTHPQWTDLDNVSAFVARTRFRDVGQGIPLQDYLRAETTFTLSAQKRRVETQRTIGVRFRRQPP